MLERQRKLYNRMSKLANRQPAPATQAIQATKSPANAISDKDAYDYAVHLVLDDKAYQKAYIAFQSFLTQHPDSVYMDNALYWVGQLEFSQNNHQKCTSCVYKAHSKVPRFE